MICELEDQAVEVGMSVDIVRMVGARWMQSAQDRKEEAYNQQWVNVYLFDR